MTESRDADGVVQQDLTVIRAVVELVLALTSHLHDIGAIDKEAVARLLRGRQELLRGEADSVEIRRLLQAQIDWLNRLGPGRQTPPVFH